MSEEWVELKLDSKRKVIMPRRELTNLAQRISRIFASVKVIKPPVDVDHPRGSAVMLQPLLEVTAARTKFDRRRKADGRYAKRVASIRRSQP